MLVPKQEFNATEGLQDFVELVSFHIKRLTDIEGTQDSEILFVEKLSTSHFLLLTKDKSRLEIEGKDLLIFLIESV